MGQESFKARKLLFATTWIIGGYKIPILYSSQNLD
jgi:hypothetical protein